MPIEPREFTFNVSSASQLKLDNISGSVVIEPGEEGIIHVTSIKHPGLCDENHTKIECAQAEDGSVSISTRFSDPGISWLFGTGPGAGMGVLVFLSGMLAALVGLSGYFFKPVRDAESILPDHDQLSRVEAT